MEDILVVDDNSMLLVLFKRILEREGLRVHCVSSGEEALKQIMERNYALMITDFNMPGLNGLELSRKGLEIAPRMPIIMDTSGNSPNFTRQAMEIGITKVLTKPFQVNELLETVREVMGNNGVRSDGATAFVSH